MTSNEFAREVVQYLEGCWPRQAPISDHTFAAMWRELGSLDAETVSAAARAVYCSGRDFMPNAGHILAEIADQTEDAPSFGEAWEQILAGVRRHGSQHPQRIIDSLDDPAVAELAAQLGLRELGMASESALTTWHAQARERYRGIVTRRRRVITHHQLPSASLRPELRGGEGRAPKRLGPAVSELVESLRPERERGAA